MPEEQQPTNGDSNDEEAAGGLGSADLLLINRNTVPTLTADDLGQANKEADEFFKKPGEKEAHERSEMLKDTFATLAKWILIGLALLLSFIIIVRVWHLGLPCSWQWLSESQIEKIDQLFNYLIVGSIGGTLFKYFQSNIGLKE